LNVENRSCKLCGSKKLPGVESHLFSEFLIKETANRPGKAHITGENSKGNELLFSYSPFEKIKLYIGRQSTEAAEKVLNKERFTDEEVAYLQSDKNENPLTDTYLVCYSCEKLFQSVEDSFRKIYSLLMSECNNEEEVRKYFKLDEEQSITTELFFNLNIWRAAASDKFNLKLDDLKFDCLTKLMQSIFIDDPENKNYNNKFLEVRGKYKCISLILFFNNERITKKGELTNNGVYTYSSKNPYLVALNRLLIFISTNDFDTVSTPSICAGTINSLISYIEHHKTYIFYINKNKLETIGKNYAYECAKMFKTFSLESFIIEFKYCLKKEPSLKEIKEMENIIEDNIQDFYSLITEVDKMFNEFGEYLYNKHIKRNEM